MSGYFSGDRVPFFEAFPTIKELQINIVTSAGITKFDNKETRTYSTKIPPPANIPCPKGGCNGNGFDLQRLLGKMVGRKATEMKEHKMCDGQEKMGRGQSRSCVGNFFIEVTLEYKPNDA